MRTLALLIALAAGSFPVLAQDHETTIPSGWNVRFDREGSDHQDLSFVDMPPGWHVTSGPAGIYYHPDSTASGNYTLTSTIHTFDPKGRNREAFGIMLGGQDLDASNQTYFYFMIRNTGDFLIKHRAGSETHVVSDWTSSDAIVQYVDGQEGTATNTLSVIVGGGSASFVINDDEVATLDINPSGVFGLRVNHGLNLHIRNLVITR